MLASMYVCKHGSMYVLPEGYGGWRKAQQQWRNESSLKQRSDASMTSDFSLKTQSKFNQFIDKFMLKTLQFLYLVELKIEAASSFFSFFGKSFLTDFFFFFFLMILTGVDNIIVFEEKMLYMQGVISDQSRDRMVFEGSICWTKAVGFELVNHPTVEIQR